MKITEHSLKPTFREILFGNAVQTIANNHATIAGGLPSRDLRELGRRTLDRMNPNHPFHSHASVGYDHAFIRLTGAAGRYPEIGRALWQVLDAIDIQFPHFSQE